MESWKINGMVYSNEVFRKKAINSKDLPLLRPDVLVPFVLEPGSSTRARNIACQNMAGSSAQIVTDVIQVYTCETCYFSSTLLAEFLAHNCEITGKNDGCF